MLDDIKKELKLLIHYKDSKTCKEIIDKIDNLFFDLEDEVLKD